MNGLITHPHHPQRQRPGFVTNQDESDARQEGPAVIIDRTSYASWTRIQNIVEVEREKRFAS